MMFQYLLSKVTDSSLATSPCTRGEDISAYMYHDPSWAEDGPVPLDGVCPYNWREHVLLKNQQIM